MSVWKQRPNTETVQCVPSSPLLDQHLQNFLSSPNDQCKKFKYDTFSYARTKKNTTLKIEMVPFDSMKTKTKSFFQNNLGSI